MPTAKRQTGEAVRKQGLFPSEAEIARRLSQTPTEWAAKAALLERAGLPRIDPVMGGRFWPAVEAYWRRRYGLSSVEVSTLDGLENLDALA
ncbi:hypothetical protein RUR49_04310 [Pseudoxanthobacter sp. M-2]|uniref:hypothetical protein n=1 Tax=Pseudoxanthobacter sp. M-2 TaxID=3078754 RepID=UPI0038FCBF73